MDVEFGYEYFRGSPAGVLLAAAVEENADEIKAAAERGEPPIFVIAKQFEPYLAFPKLVRHADRFIGEWLGSSFEIRGREPWPAEWNIRFGARSYRKVGEN